MLNTKNPTLQVLAAKTDHTNEFIILESYIYHKIAKTVMYTLIASDAKSDEEIKRRTRIAQKAFRCMSNVLTARNINRETKLRLIKCYIWSTMLYGCETWRIGEAMKKQLEAAEMWC